MMDNNPMIDNTRVYKGQTYICVGFQDYTRKDGHDTTLVRWQTDCYSCGDTFTFLLAGSSDKAYPFRRCGRHRKPGPITKPAKQAGPGKRAHPTISLFD